MAKPNPKNIDPKPQPENRARPNGEPPAEWRDVETPVSGYWNEQEPICGTVQGAREFVNSKGRKTRVYLLKLLKPTTARVKLEGGGFDDVELSIGELCGVFESAGLRSLETLCNARVWIKRAGERVTRNGTMKTYALKSPDPRAPVKVEEYTPRGKESDDGAPNIDEVPF